MQQEMDGRGIDSDRLKDELNMYKGRCQNLLRDIEIHTGAVNKMSSDQGSMGEQMSMYRERISQLEADLAKARED